MKRIQSSGIFRSLPQNDDYDSTQPKNGLFTIHYAKKDVNNIKDTKSLETLSKLDSSIDRFVKLLNNSNEKKKSLNDKKDSEEEKNNSNETTLRNFDEYCKVSENGFYECLHCPEVSLSVEEFKKHYKESHLKIYYDCEKCGFSTRCFGTIADHINKYHDNDISIIKRRIYRVTSNQDDFPSRVQSLFTNNQKSQNQSLLSTNLINNSLNCLQNGKELIIDSDSEKVDGEESDQESEYEFKMNGTSRHQCRICQQEFTRSERVREHYDAIHLNIAYVCSLCGYTNRWKRSVIQHLRSKHDRSPPYKPLMLRKKVDNVNKNNVTTSRNDPNGKNVRLTKSISIKNGRIINLNKPISDDLRLSTIIDIYSEPNNLLPHYETQKSSSSFLSNNHQIFKNINYPSFLSENKHQSSQSIHLRLVWVCRKCGFSHKWKIILTNHLRADHNLSPPFNQYLIRRKENNSPAFLTLNQANAKLKSNNEITVKLVPPKPSENLTINTSKDFSQTNLYSKPMYEVSELQNLEISKVNPNFQCKLCSKNFDTIRGLREHSDGMHKNMVWACKLCPYTDKWRPQAITHLRNKHKCKPPYSEHIRRISKWSMSVSRPTQPISLQEGEAEGETKKEKNLTNPSLIFDSFQKNKEKEQDEEKKNLGEVLSNREDFDEVEEEKKLKIDELNESLNLSSDDIFKMSDLGEEKFNLKDCYLKLSNDQYQCKLCSKICGSAQGITEHYEAYHLNMLYYCQLCDFTDVWRSMMTRHLKLKHKVCKPYDIYLKRKKMEKEDTNLNKPENFLKVKILAPQNISPLNGIVNQTLIKPKITEDPSYGKQYVHINNQLKCKICWSLFTSLQGFQEHYEAIHLDIIWTCRVCKHSFRWRQQLTKHLKLIHSCEPPFNEYMLKETGSHKLKKPIPDKTCKLIQGAKTAILPKTIQVKNFTSILENDKLNPSSSNSDSSRALSEIKEISTSGLSYAEKVSSLKNYTYTNNQFACKLCSAIFSSLQGFQEHYEAIHLNVVYACKICGFENRWRPQVTTHLKRSHSCEPPYGDYMVKQRSSNILSKDLGLMQTLPLIDDEIIDDDEVNETDSQVEEKNDEFMKDIIDENVEDKTDSNVFTINANVEDDCIEDESFEIDFNEGELSQNESRENDFNKVETLKKKNVKPEAEIINENFENFNENNIENLSSLEQEHEESNEKSN